MEESFPKNEVKVSKESGGVHQQMLDEIRNILKNHFLNSEELVEIFDKKFSAGEVVQLLDEQGEALKDFNGKRVDPVEFEKIDRHNKEVYVRGLLYSFSLNPVDLAEKLSKETALLDVIDRDGGNLKKLIENSKNN